MKFRWKCAVGSILGVFLGIPLLLGIMLAILGGGGWLIANLFGLEHGTGAFIIVGLGLSVLGYFVCVEEHY